MSRALRRLSKHQVLDTALMPVRLAITSFKRLIDTRCDNCSGDGKFAADCKPPGPLHRAP
jgi:hypothetical protein